MHYFIAIELPKKDADTAYGVVVPDIPGCFSAGDTLNALHYVQVHITEKIENLLACKP